jgi:hypothetical protein
MLGAAEVVAGLLGEVADDQLDVFGLGVEAGADGGGADVLLRDRQSGRLQALDSASKRQRVGGELLAEPDRDGVLHVRSAGLDDVVELDGLLLEGVDQLLGGRA